MFGALAAYFGEKRQKFSQIKKESPEVFINFKKQI